MRSAPEYPSKLTDPEFLRQRASRAGQARTGVDYHVRKLVEAADELTEQTIAGIVARAPKMTEEQAARIRRLFRYAPADQVT